MPQRIVNDARYSFVVLALLACVTGFIATMVSLRAVHDSNQGWCQVIDILTEDPVVKPSDPAKNPSQEKSWEIYLKLADRKRTLGC